MFENCQSESICKSDIVLPKNFPAIFVSARNEVFCYTGTLLKNEKREPSIKNYSWQFQEKSPMSKIVTDNVLGFYRISKGCIVVDNFLDTIDDGSYKLTNKFLRLPYAAGNFFGVLEEVTLIEDKDLTREVFGLTHSELIELLDVYSKTLGLSSEYISYPRLTKSVRTNNFCDMTNAWIPQNFPYITFSNRGNKYSHVSLEGFYQHVQMLFYDGASTPVCQLFMKNGLTENTLKNILGINNYSFISARKVDYSMINPLE